MEQETQGSWVVIVIFVVVGVVIAGLAIRQKKKRREAQWTGVVIDKNMTEQPIDNRRNDTNNTGGFSLQLGGQQRMQRDYSLRIRDTQGKEFSWGVGEGIYQSVNVGDQLRKDPGTETPTVVNKATNTTPAQADNPANSGQPTPFV